MKKKLIMVGIASPFVVLIIWILSGVFGGSETNLPARKGLNTELPGVRGSRDSTMDKLSFYAAAQMDSVKRREQIEMDSYRKEADVDMEPEEAVPVKEYSQKIKSMQQQLLAYRPKEAVEIPLTQMSESVPEKVDPEIEAINQTLDKLMAIQNPQKNITTTHTGRVSFTVGEAQENDTTYFGKRNSRKTQSAFHEDIAIHHSRAITAVVPVEQSIQNGSVVKLELRVAVSVNGITLPAGTNVFGIASLEGERLLIQIHSIRFQNNLLPVSLKVYDMDGLEGIYVPGALSRDVLKTTADNAVQSAGISGFDMSLKTQAAAAGIGAAKSLLSKKVKQVRVSVFGGYQVLLYDSKQNN